MIEYIDIAGFKKVEGILDNTLFMLVIKSQDQIERRRRMIESRKKGKFGRINQRPVATGLVTAVELKKGKVDVLWKKEFREPRHIKRHPEKGYILTEVDDVLWINEEANIISKFKYPFFSFLHSVDLSDDNQRILITSSGYDCCFEIDIDKWQVVWEWFAWENGFNPDEDGNWLAVKKEKYLEYLKEGKKSILVDPCKYKEYGIATSYRTAHPNVAVYDIYYKNCILVCIAHKGEIYRINKSNFSMTCVCKKLNQMPHGIYPYKNWWMITNTVKGEWWLFTENWTPLRVFVVKNLPYKVPGTEEVEWLQQVIPITQYLFLAIDANRGLIGIDIKEKRYSLYRPDPNWCIQDALFIK